MSAKRKIPELSNIPFTGAKSITQYSREGRSLCRDLGMEFEFAADEVRAALIASQKGHPALLGVDVRLRARRVARRLKRASELQKASGAELVRFHAQFRREFADVLNPPKPKKTFNFKDE